MVPFVRRKRKTRVSFETLLPVATDRPPYHLRAIVLHDGDAGTGHYTAYVRAVTNKWYHCNDKKKPREVGISEVLSETSSEQAYVPFFEI